MMHGRKNIKKRQIKNYVVLLGDKL